jgi:hypothetical protein
VVKGGQGRYRAAHGKRRENVDPRTVRRHLSRLTKLGILERRRAFGGARYRRVDRLDDRAIAYIRRLEAVRETFVPGQGPYPYWRDVRRAFGWLGGALVFGFAR